MIIKNLYIKSFGKISNKNIEFKKGFNIVYGNNETGKSTMQAFIKVMLYGMNNKRGKEKRSNERIRYLPLVGGKAEGEIQLNVNNENLLICREFGRTKKEDKCKVINSITGEEAVEYSKGDPGKCILNINSESFQNTLLIKQLGSGIVNFKEDELINKIVNTLESGDASVSYQRTRNNLEDLKKSLSTSRKNGKLDILKEKYHKLLEERNRKSLINEENIHNELDLIKLKKQRDNLNRDINLLELSKKYLKKLKLQKEYKEIQKYLMKSKDLKIQKQLIDGELQKIVESIDDEFLIRIREEANQYFDKINILKVKKENIQVLKEKIMDKEKNIEQFNEIKRFEGDIEEKVFKLWLEEDSIKENYTLIIQIKKELKELMNKQIFLKNKIKNHKITIKSKEEIEKSLQSYEEKLKEIKKIMETCDLNFSTEKEFKNTKKMINFSNMIIGIFLGLLLFNILKFNGNNRVQFIILVSFLLTVIITTILIRVKKLKYIEYINKESLKLEKIKEINNDILIIEENLEEYNHELGKISYEELINLIKEFNILCIELEKVNKKIEEKNNNFNSLKGNEIVKKVTRNNEIKRRFLEVSGYESLSKLLEIIRIFKKEKKVLDELNKNLKDMEKIILDLEEEIKVRENSIKDKLKKINFNITNLEDIFDELDRLNHKLQVKRDIEKTLKSMDEGYKILLKNRDVEKLQKEIKDFIETNDEFSYESEEEIEKKIKTKNEDLLKTEKKIKDVEFYISKIMLSTRSLSLIDEDIERVEKEIYKYEKQLKAISKALRLLKESFKVIQNSFGPLLNKKVSEIFSQLTNNEYNQVMVSENYDLILRNSKSHSLININNLSNGTWDQVYLSLRLAIIHLIFGEKTIPIILDESFSQYDEIRLKNVLKIFYELSNNKQVILFTCQKREMELLKDYSDINIINL